MARYAAGEEIAFKPLVALLAPRIRAFFLRSFSDVTIADSLTEMTFLRLRRARASYRPELPLKAWMFGIAAAVRGEELRRRYGLPADVGEAELIRAEAPGADVPLPAPMPDGHVCEKEAARAALARLPESQRVVIHLYAYEGLTFTEIAHVLGTTPEAVRARACTAYLRLQSSLQTLLRTSNGAPQ